MQRERVWDTTVSDILDSCEITRDINITQKHCKRNAPFPTSNSTKKEFQSAGPGHKSESAQQTTPRRTTWGTNGNVGNLVWGSESEFPTGSLRSLVYVRNRWDHAFKIESVTEHDIGAWHQILRLYWTLRAQRSTISGAQALTHTCPAKKWSFRCYFTASYTFAPCPIKKLVCRDLCTVLAY